MRKEGKTASPSIQLEEPPEGLTKIHENEDLVRIKIERRFYKQLEEKAEMLETTPDKLIYNAILLILKSLEKEGEEVRLGSV